MNDIKVLPFLGLVVMVEGFIKKSSKHSGFFLYNLQDLLKAIEQSDKKCIIWGVTYALLDLAEKYPGDLSDVLIVETGGMKGQRKELTREELYSILRSSLNVKSIFAEYGMTELLSQAYAENGIFKPADTMKVMVRDVNDPFSYLQSGMTGGINIVDLANIHSCAFIETKDLGKVYNDGSFEVLGRFDNSDLRGCNLMVL